MNPPLRPQSFVDDWVYDATKGIVQIGPFAGMKLPREKAWESGCLAPMLLGTHEQELHFDLEKEITRLEPEPFPKVVNVGCAEGYYAVGLARRLLHATVWAVDIDAKAIKIAQRAAIDNGVKIITDASLEEVFAAPDLVVMDCESFEKVYLDMEKFPALAKATIIVELHNMPDEENAGQVLVRRFKDSHDIWVINEGSRNPNEFHFLLGTPSTFRWACVCENRPCFMNWFVMRPK